MQLDTGDAGEGYYWDMGDVSRPKFTPNGREVELPECLENMYGRWASMSVRAYLPYLPRQPMHAGLCTFLLEPPPLVISTIMKIARRSSPNKQPC